MTVWQYVPATAHRILKGLYVRSKALLCLLKSYLANPALPLILKYHPKGLIYSLVIFVLCIPFSTTASVFFQQSLINETDKGLSVHVDKVEASTLLNAWCEVCHKNCIMKHDTKIKVNIHEDHISCHELLTDLLTTTQLQLIQNQDRLVFLPPQKREWITYSFQNRSAHEVATLLAKLSPKQSLFADKVNNNLWMPYDFYQQHAAAIKQLDTPNHCYQILLSLVHINEQHSQHPEDTGTNQALSWLKDYLAPIEWQQAISWLLMLEQKGMISYASQYILQCGIGKTAYSSMQENFTIDGKTNKHSLLALDHETTILSQTLNEITLHLKVTDATSSSNPKSSYKTYLDTVVSLPLDKSMTAGGITKEFKHRKSYCVPILGQLPLLNRVFCKTTQTTGDDTFMLVVSARKR